MYFLNNLFKINAIKIILFDGIHISPKRKCLTYQKNIILLHTYGRISFFTKTNTDQNSNQNDPSHRANNNIINDHTIFKLLGII